MGGWVLRRALVAISLSLASTSAAHAGSVAMTFDDLPVSGPDISSADAVVLTDTLLAGFAREQWPVTGFVNEGQFEDPNDVPLGTALLARWLDAGCDLGNHGYSHVSLNVTPIDAYIADVARGEIVTAALLGARGRSEKWFRYPYLETGLTADIRRRFAAWLVAHGYDVAPVTMENSDWQFSEPYDDALRRGDLTGARDIRAAYLRYTGKIVPWYRKAGRALLGREPAFVFLLHANQLNADSMDALARILRRQHLRPVTLAQAMRDPAYRIADNYVGPDGETWLERWSQSMRRSLPWDSMLNVPAAIVAADARLEEPR